MATDRQIGAEVLRRLTPVDRNVLLLWRRGGIQAVSVELARDGREALEIVERVRARVQGVALQVRREVGPVEDEEVAQVAVAAAGKNGTEVAPRIVRDLQGAIVEREGLIEQARTALRDMQTRFEAQNRANAQLRVEVARLKREAVPASAVEDESVLVVERDEAVQARTRAERELHDLQVRFSEMERDLDRLRETRNEARQSAQVSLLDRAVKAEERVRELEKGGAKAKRGSLKMAEPAGTPGTDFRDPRLREAQARVMGLEKELAAAVKAGQREDDTDGDALRARIAELEHELVAGSIGDQAKRIEQLERDLAKTDKLLADRVPSAALEPLTEQVQELRMRAEAAEAKLREGKPRLGEVVSKSVLDETAGKLFAALERASSLESALDKADGKVAELERVIANRAFPAGDIQGDLDAAREQVAQLQVILEGKGVNPHYVVELREERDALEQRALQLTDEVEALRLATRPQPAGESSDSPRQRYLAVLFDTVGVPGCPEHVHARLERLLSDPGWLT